MLQSSLPSPLDEETSHVLREMQVGSSLEQALLDFSWRVQSPALDALLSSVLIARRVGGSLPQVLEITANTLREMARLEGVLRSKTAQARAQMWVLGCLPPGIVLAFNTVRPGYFEPLTASPIGTLLLIAAIVLWLSAIMLARRILGVAL
jgi:tight adherence protein B